MFVEPKLRESRAYREFRDTLGRGEFEAGEFKRICKEVRGDRPRPAVVEEQSTVTNEMSSSMQRPAAAQGHTRLFPPY